MAAGFHTSCSHYMERIRLIGPRFLSLIDNVPNIERHQLSDSPLHVYSERTRNSDTNKKGVHMVHVGVYTPEVAGPGTFSQSFKPSLFSSFTVLDHLENSRDTGTNSRSS